ncbi:MAG TPA: hypothetical protein VF293_07275 [Candidatus Limnocylindrales bacterium]
MQRPTLATRRISPPIDLFAAGREASILGGPVDHDVRSHPAVELSDVRRERAGYLHRGIVPRLAA